MSAVSQTPLPDDLATLLAERLAHPLPGAAAQTRFAPELSFGRHCGPPASDARNAAVMALLYKKQGDWHLAMTLRPDTLPDHAGQVCFPGGATQPGESSQATALRELEEELCVPAQAVQVLGMLSSLYVFNSNFWVTPFVGYCATRPDFQACPREVARVVELPMCVALDTHHHGYHRIQRGRISFRAPHIAHCGLRIWGATSMILGELIEILSDVQSPS